MGDMGEYWRDSKEFVQEKKQGKRQANMEYLDKCSLEWKWIDKGCDHILIEGHMDYYLGKTYWYNRKTHKSGYTMIKDLHITKNIKKEELS